MFAFGIVTVAMTFFYSLRFIGMTFYGPKSKHVEELEREGVHLHEASPVMWVPYTILVAITIAIGVAGIWFEHTLHHIFHSWAEESLPALAVTAAHAPSDGVYTVMILAALSAAMLIVGGIPAAVLYVTRRVSAEEIVDRSPALRALHSFLWNRWYINPFYYKVFVDGVLALKDWLFKWFETLIVDGGFNRAVPYVATKIYMGVRRMQTGVLSYNMFYVFFTLLALLVVAVFVVM